MRGGLNEERILSENEKCISNENSEALYDYIALLPELKESTLVHHLVHIRKGAKVVEGF